MPPDIIRSTRSIASRMPLKRPTKQPFTVTPVLITHNDAQTIDPADTSNNKTPIKVNVDTIEGYVRGENLFISDALYSVLRKSDEIKSVSQKPVQIEGKDRIHKLSVFTRKDGHELHFSGSPFGCMYGQNVHTPSSVRLACMVALKMILKECNFEYLDGRNIWKPSEVILTRVDLAVQFCFESEVHASHIIKQLRRQFAECDVPNAVYATGVMYRPGKGEEYSFRVYMKGAELAHSGRHNCSSDHKRLFEESKKIIRVELQLRGRALRKHSLTHASDWTAGKVQEIFRRYMRLLPISNVKAGPITAQDLFNLTPAQRRVVKAYKQGDLSGYSKRTLAKYTKELKKEGWEISQPYTEESDIPQLEDLFKPGRTMKGPSEWMKTAGLYPEDD